MKHKYIAPALQVIALNKSEIVTTSNLRVVTDEDKAIYNWEYVE